MTHCHHGVSLDEDCFDCAEEDAINAELDRATQQKEIDMADQAHINDLRGFNDYPPDDFNPYEGRNDPEDY